MEQINYMKVIKILKFEIGLVVERAKIMRYKGCKSGSNNVIFNNCNNYAITRL